MADMAVLLDQDPVLAQFGLCFLLNPLGRVNQTAYDCTGQQTYAKVGGEAANILA